MDMKLKEAIMTTQEVFSKINDDEAFIAKMKAECKTPEQAFELLKEAGLTDDLETFKKTASEMNEAVTRMNDKDVDAIVGGTGTVTEPVTTTTTSSAAAATASI